MKLWNKKYLYSLGIAYYAEKEMERLAEQARAGWHFQKLNWLGFLVFEKDEPKDCQYAIDFLADKLIDKDEYVAIYQEAGWKLITCLFKRYYFFEAPVGTPAIYSDEQSYRERMKRERRWLIIQMLVSLGIGLLIFMGLAASKNSSNPLLTNSAVRFAVYFTAVILLALFVSTTIASLFSSLVYRNRSRFYGKPKEFALHQKTARDTWIVTLICAVLGAFLGYFSSVFW